MNNFITIYFITVFISLYSFGCSATTANKNHLSLQPIASKSDELWPFGLEKDTTIASAVAQFNKFIKSNPLYGRILPLSEAEVMNAVGFSRIEVPSELRQGDDAILAKCFAEKKLPRGSRLVPGCLERHESGFADTITFVIRRPSGVYGPDYSNLLKPGHFTRIVVRYHFRSHAG